MPGTRESIWFKIMHYGLEFIGLHYSKYRAFVIDNDDPEKLNRLQLRIPHLNDLADDDTWSFPAGNWGGKDYGINILPQKGDMVWVEFEHGNPDYPVWSFASYGTDEKPIEFETVKHYGFKTPSGTILLINDNKDKESFELTLSSLTEWFKTKKDEVEIESKLIKLGKDGAEKAVLGDTLKAKLDELINQNNAIIDAINSHTHTTSVGPSGPPINISTFTNIKTQLNTLKSSLQEFISNKVKID